MRRKHHAEATFLSRPLEIAAEEHNHSPHGIKLRQTVKVMALVGIDLHLVWDVVVFEQGFKFLCSLHRHSGVTPAMQDQHGRELGGIGRKMVGQAPEKLCDCGNPGLLCGQRE